MPRPKSPVPTYPITAYVSQENFAALELLAHSETLGKKPHGELSRIVNEALKLYFLNFKKEA